jgi:uracil-DNA glycosylase
VARPESTPSLQVLVERHLADVRACRACPNVVGTPITPRPVATATVYLCGQAPGTREEKLGRPFAWQAGKQLFKWFDKIGVDEERFRSRAYIGAIARCFPGKTKQKVDRVPDEDEIASCSRWMAREFELLRPRLVVAVGKIAIDQFTEEPGLKLVDTVGKLHRVTRFGVDVDVIPLPHPSGASTWYLRPPGKRLLGKALRLLREHDAWRSLLED